MTYERPPTSNQCAICGQPATWSTLKDPWGKSDEMEGRCAKHSPKLLDPDDVALIDRQRAEIERLTRERDEAEQRVRDIDALWHGQSDVIAERDRLRAALEWCVPAPVVNAHPSFPGCCDDGRFARETLRGSSDETNRDAADAARYRWLKAEDRKRMPLATISWRQRSNGLPCKLADNDPLDALIDAAITSPDASVEQVYRTAVKASGLCSAHQYPNPGERDYTPTCRVCFPQKAKGDEA